MMRYIVAIAIGSAVGAFWFGLQKAMREEAIRQGHRLEPGSLAWQATGGPPWSGPVVGALIAFGIAFPDALSKGGHP